ncbi:hypothetical protein [Roseobacter litoralis]|uniref:hypothetical protein n=1 Tax=Roseobacter litoralis TaxID=42443 RepID=UPI0024930828|nr:hypothetical protein [Roseobacter litoralis]
MGKSVIVTIPIAASIAVTASIAIAVTASIPVTVAASIPVAAVVITVPIIVVVFVPIVPIVPAGVACISPTSAPLSQLEDCQLAVTIAIGLRKELLGTTDPKRTDKFVTAQHPVRIGIYGAKAGGLREGGCQKGTDYENRTGATNPCAQLRHEIFHHASRCQ